MTERRAVDGVRDPFVLGVQVDEVPVVGERLLVLLVVEVGVRDRQLGAHRVLAVGVVVDDGLEGLDRALVVRVGNEAEPGLAGEDALALGIELVGGRHLLELGRALGAGNGDEETDDDGNGLSRDHGDPKAAEGRRAAGGRLRRKLPARCRCVNLLRFSATHPTPDAEPAMEGTERWTAIR